MSIKERIDKQKALLIDKAILSYKEHNRGLSTALKLMISDIQKMRDDGLSLHQQIEILSGIFDVTIKYDTYKKWSQRHFKKEIKNAHVTTEKVAQKVQKIDTKKDKKVAQKSEPEKSIEEIFNEENVVHSVLADLA